MEGVEQGVEGETDNELTPMRGRARERDQEGLKREAGGLLGGSAHSGGCGR